MSLELITDGSFELGSPLWSYTGTGTRDLVVNPHDGLWAGVVLNYRFDPFGQEFTGTVGQQVTQNVTPGDTIYPSAWIRLQSSSGSDGTMPVWVDFGDGSPVITILYEADFTVGEWKQVTLPPVVATTDEVTYTFKAALVGIGTGFKTWHVDLASLLLPGVAAMKRGKWKAIQRLLHLLATQITGHPNYHLDLGAKVFPRLIIPGEKEGLRPPYLCVPLLDDAQSFDGHDHHLLGTSWTQKIWGFVPETMKLHGTEMSGAQSSSLLQEDTIKAILGDLYLGGLLNGPARLVSSNTVSGVDDTGYAEFELSLSLSMNFARDDLGPE